MKLIMARHGETVENVKKQCQGQKHGTLSENGKSQARKLALRFMNEKFDVIFSSDLRRAKHTAQEIAKFHPKIPLKYDKRLRERFMGSLEGRSFSEREFGNLPEDTESDEQLCKRAKDFLDEIFLMFKDKTVLLVTHGGAKMALITVLLKRPVSEFNNIGVIDNTAVSEFEVSAGKGNAEMKVFNCTKHLS